MIVSMLGAWRRAITGWVALEPALVITTLAQATLFSHQHVENQMLLIIPSLYVIKRLREADQSVLVAVSMLSMLVLPGLLIILLSNQGYGSPWIGVPIPLVLAIMYAVVGVVANTKDSATQRVVPTQACSLERPGYAGEE
jgi:hypothetical protein